MRKEPYVALASKNEEHNNAVVLKDLLEGMRKPPTGTGPGAVRSHASAPGKTHAKIVALLGAPRAIVAAKQCRVSD